MGETVDPVRPFLLFVGLCAVFFRYYSSMQVKLKGYEVRNAHGSGCVVSAGCGGRFWPAFFIIVP